MTPTDATQQPPSVVNRRRASTMRAVLLVVVVVVIVLMSGAAELAARYYERHRAIPPDYFPSIFYPHRRLRYGLVPNMDYYGWFKINSHGFRGREFALEKPRGVFRIVCLGASTTFDVGTVGAHKPWPEVMERELRRRLGREDVEVLNLGIPGATSLDSLIDLQTRALAFHPDLLVVYQGHNDFIYSIPQPYEIRTNLLPQEDRPRGSAERWLTMHSLLYAKGSGRVTDLLNKIGQLLPIRSTQTRKITARERQHALDQGLWAFSSNLKSVAAIAHANHVELALPQVVIPFASAAKERCHVCGGLSAAYGGLSVDQVASNFDRYTQVLSQLAALPGVHYISTNGFVPASDLFYNDAVHFNAEGSRRMGEQMAAALVPFVSSTLPVGSRR